MSRYLPFSAVTADERLGGLPSARGRVERVLRALPELAPRVLCHNDSAACEALAHVLAPLHAEVEPRNGHATEHQHVFAACGTQYPSSVAERVSQGKGILHLAARRGGFVSVFDPPAGVVCHPFHKLVLGTQCPYDCAYCYLQITYRIAPYVRQYLNLEDLRAELARLDARLNGPTLLNAGELGDPLALDPQTRVVEELISWLPELPNVRILLLTKSGNTGHLPALPPSLRGRVIVAASLTSDANRQALEHGTATISERMSALATAQEKGYGVRARFDPIVTSRTGWEAEYEAVVRDLMASVDCDVITLGQPRFFPQLLSIAEKRFPGARHLLGGDFSAVTADHRIRSDRDERIVSYRAVMDMIRDHSPGAPPPVMLCKEEPEVLRALNVANPRLCNCTLG